MRILITFLVLYFSGFMMGQQIDPEILEELRKQNNIQIEDSAFEDLSIDGQEEKTVDETNDQVQENEKSIFGHDFIKSIPKSISGTSDLPVPNGYKISLNDKLDIVLSGSKEAIYSLSVGLNGSILIPEVGSVQVVGNTFKELKDKLQNIFDVSFVGVDVNVNIKDLSAKKITIIGAVKNPGTYLVNPFTTISSSLAYSGGLEDYASLRNIQVVSVNQNNHVFDLYDLLINGDRSDDISLSAGDTLIIGATTNHVTLQGEVIRPKVYEYLPDDKYLDLIEFALGPNRNADISNLSATINEKSERVTKAVNSNNLVGNKDLEELYVGRNVTIDSQDVFVAGSAVTSGYYSASNQTLSNFLKNLKFSSEIYPFFATFEKISGSGLIKEMKSFSLADPSSYSDLRVSKNTKLNFYSRDEILAIQEQEQTLDFNNLVSLSLPDKKMRIPIKGKFAPRQIHLFFGTSSEIDKDRVSVVTSENSFTSVYEDYFDADDLVALSFPSINNENLIEVSIEGEVYSPGIYLVASSTSLYDLYVLAGGFRNSAFEEGIAIYREDVKERQSKAIKEAKLVLTDAMIQKSTSISERGMLDIESIIELADLIEPTGRIAGEFYEDSDSSKNFTLKAGDSIVVPSASFEVVVQGEVLNSSSFIFDESLKYSDYIEAAGGFSEYADKRSVFIIKSNGLSVITGTSVFSGQAEIEPGDIIVVPRNLDQLEPLPLISMATKIIADLAFSAASLNAIQD